MEYYNLLPITALLIIYGVESVSAIACYSCTTKEDPTSCSDSVINTFLNTKTMDAVSILPCSYCTKFKVTIDDGDYIERSCLPTPGLFSVNECVESQQGQMCLCDSELCNGATTTAYAACTIVTGLIAVLTANTWAGL